MIPIVAQAAVYVVLRRRQEREARLALPSMPSGDVVRKTDEMLARSDKGLCVDCGGPKDDEGLCAACREDC